ncbi:LLM class F420-dependent oxidoreductase [Saccharopolyspora rosea]|uniref:LLM class F420-dependent oxidoreductase n=1 Tax=Saccharopolyspora rosea TaxID=524884 RepID=A0ABW3FXU5_9PSEU
MRADRSFDVGVWLAPQHTTVDRLRDAWRAADAEGVDSLWLWDHFFPLTGDPDGTHFEAWTLLAAMAADTRTATIGPLVTNYEFRNPDLLADMARTVDHLCGGRLVLGLGAGWVERDCAEYGYRFRPAPERVAGLEDAVRRVRARLDVLNPPPRGDLPLLIGGDGRRILLRLVAQHADRWNTMAWKFVESSRHLDAWCARVGRDPGTLRRSAFITEPDQLDLLDDLLRAGADEVVVQLRDPFDMAPVRTLLARSRRATA